MNLSMVFIYKFCNKCNPTRTRRTSRISSRWRSTKKVHKKQIYRKAHFEKSAKKLKMKSQDRKNVVFGKFIWKLSKIVLFWVLWLKFLFFCNFSKLHFLVILSFMNFFVAQTSITFFSMFEKLNTSTIYKSIILIFSVNLPLVFFYKIYEKEIQTRREPRELKGHLSLFHL